MTTNDNTFKLEVMVPIQETLNKFHNLADTLRTIVALTPRVTDMAESYLLKFEFEYGDGRNTEELALIGDIDAIDVLDLRKAIAKVRDLLG